MPAASHSKAAVLVLQDAWHCDKCQKAQSAGAKAAPKPPAGKADGPAKRKSGAMKNGRKASAAAVAASSVLSPEQRAVKAAADTSRMVDGGRVHLALPASRGLSMARRGRDSNKHKRLFVHGQEGGLRVSICHLGGRYAFTNVEDHAWNACTHDRGHPHAEGSSTCALCTCPSASQCQIACLHAERQQHSCGRPFPEHGTSLTAPQLIGSSVKPSYARGCHNCPFHDLLAKHCTHAICRHDFVLALKSVTVFAARREGVVHHLSGRDLAARPGSH